MKIKINNNEIKTKLKKITDNTYKFVKEKYDRLCTWYKGYENKRALWGAVSTWIFTFLVVIIVCRVTNASKLTAVANETIMVEAESSYETTERDRNIVKEETKAKETQTTTAATTTASETQSIEEITKKTEKETVDVSKLSVSTTPIADDKEASVKRIASINSADIKTIPSTNYDENQISYGIDISYHQGKIDWAKVKAAGVEYAFIRVGNRGYESGKLCKDSRFDENVRGALANGIKVGVYFFSQAITEQEALEEASLTLKYISGYNITLPVVIDWETDKGYRTYSGLTQSKLTNIISVFCDTVERYGYDSMVYMCKDDYVNRINSPVITSKYKSWVAWYFNEYDSSNYAANMFHYGDLLPDMTFKYYMWQYSCKGRIDGIKELVDMNVMILPKKVYEVKINNTKKQFVTNVGTALNLSEGISASDSSGNDASSKVTMSVFTGNGTKISKENAFAKAGTYNISYEFTDANGTKVSTGATLYVRDIPEIYFDNKLWSDSNKKKITYEYDNNLSVQENYDKIVELLKSKVSAYYYDTVSGSAKHQINNGTFSSLENIIANGDIESKTIDIAYIVNDGKGLSNSKTITFNINRQKVEEDTTTKKNEEDTTTEENHTDALS